jgi:hypothetical protein
LIWIKGRGTMPNIIVSDMKPARMRYPLVFFAAMFLANSAVAAARACMLAPAAQEHTAIQVFDGAGDKVPCPEADSAANDLAHCAQSYKGNEQTFSFDAPTGVVAPPLSPLRVWFPAASRPFTFSLSPSVLGPSLTILFRNLRI